MPRRIGLFGGTFDPPHNAHLELARRARDELALDELRWIPVGQPWQKARTITPAADREAMVRLAIGDEPRFVLERCELERAGPSFTLDTVRELQTREPDAHWFLVIGQDQYAGLHSWHHWRELLARVTLAVARRPGVAAEPDAEVRRVQPHSLSLPMMDIAATTIRARVAAGAPVTDLVPPAVASYIGRHRLYQGG